MFFKNKNKLKLKEILSYTEELNWANIFHDSIKGQEYLANLPLNIGRWAGNYSFFYILNRILKDYKPLSIIELGLGESTRFISTYVENYLINTEHVVIEHDQAWINAFQEKFKLSNTSRIVNCELEDILINNYKTTQYYNLSKKIDSKFDLYIIDGPFGSDRFSRYNIVALIEKFNKNTEFIILMDDYERKGEKDTCEDIITKLKTKGIKHYTQQYSGIKNQLIIVTEKYKYATSF